MIITKLMGGLGNQMFQYAVARTLSHLNNVPLKLDLSWFSISSAGLTPRKYELHPFNIIEEFPSPDELSKFDNIIRKFTGLLKFPITSKYMYLSEKHFNFCPTILQSSSQNAYLDGYWQSEKYFESIKSIIRKEFTFKNNPDGLNLRLAQKLQNTDVDSVSLHFRRGDYVANPAVKRFHGICPIDYYHVAVERIAAHLHKPHFMIFSDDPAWVVENFKTDFPFTIVSHNGTAFAYEDLRLMSLCKHHIIANSTFSWWGAWLSRNPGKLVIAPQRWFNDDKMNTKDLIPEKWITI